MSFNPLPNPAIPYGSLVLVSGASGYIGSHVVEQLLAAGFKVRGTTRDARKNSWVQEYFDSRYASGQFQLVEVPNMEAANAFDTVIEGASGFVHVANDMTGSKNADVAIPRAVNGALNAVKALSKQPGHKRFVFTSSSFAATLPKPGVRFTITKDTFNEESVERAGQPDPPGEAVYAASKVAAERAIVKWVAENKPDLEVNFILPNGNVGRVLRPDKQGYPTSARWVKAIWDQDYEAIKNTPPQYFVNVEDDAKLHVIALIHPSVKNERIFAVTGRVSMQDIVVIMRELYPGKAWPEFPRDDVDLCVFDTIERAEGLLAELYGHGFVDLRESVRQNAEGLD